jgi:hypothetical protein
MLEYLIRLESHGEDKMPKLDIEEFAKLIINEVRDASIASCDMLLNPDGNSMTAKRWRNKLNSGSPKDLATTIIPDCVDNTLFYLFQAIDSGILQISYKASNGNVVDLNNEGLGELAGWYIGINDGWRMKYSKQRVIDDYEDLKHFDFGSDSS